MSAHRWAGPLGGFSMAKRGGMGKEPGERTGAHARKSPANSRPKGLAKSVVIERYYTAGGEVAVPGSIGLEPEVEAMCALLAGVSLRLNRERAVNRARLRVVK
jgi:hypothetical protein